MEASDEKLIEIINGFTRNLVPENITVLNLSGRNLLNVDTTELPANLMDINLSHNKLQCVPVGVTNLRHLKILNLSYNKIECFDDTPEFCHNLESLDLANNSLIHPPFWVWSANPEKLAELDISCNYNMRLQYDAKYNNLLQYKTSLTTVQISNCRIQYNIELLGTFPKVKNLYLGTEDPHRITGNILQSVPCIAMEQYCDLERLNMKYNWLSIIKPTIEMYKHLVEIDLSQNVIGGLPKEFCNLINLETCVLSHNIIVDLPDDVIKLKKLTTLIIDNNKLYMLPENIFELPCLVKLDIYNNDLYEIPKGYQTLEELDVAQNYFEEPESGEYVNMKNELRSNMLDRCNGRKFEIVRPSRQSSLEFNSDDEDALSEDNSENSHVNNEDVNRSSSSEEDWDSDEYWVPVWNFPRHDGVIDNVNAYYNTVIRDKVDGSQEVRDSDGQFDDYSSDDS